MDTFVNLNTFLIPGYGVTYISSSILLLILIWNVYEVKKNLYGTQISLFTVIAVIGFMLLLPVLIVLISIFLAYRQILCLILKIKYGSRFKGMVNGADAFHMINEPSESLLHILFVFGTKNPSPKHFFDSMKRVACKLAEVPKFNFIFHDFCGYHCLLQDKVDTDECITKMKTVSCRNAKMEKNELMQLTNDYINEPMSKNGKAMWHVFIGMQALNWWDDENMYYPVVLRCHHGLCDGVALTKLLNGAFADNDIEVVSSELHISESIKPKLLTTFVKKIADLYNITWNGLQILINTFRVLALLPTAGYVNFLLKANDKNILHGPPLSGHKIIGMCLESSSEYFEKVKRIKSKIPGISFPEIILTACSASLTNYFEKNSTTRPENITAVIPIILEAAKLPQLNPGKFDINSIEINNSFSFMVMNFPLFIQDKNSFDKSTPLLDRLKLVNREINIFRNSADYQINYLASLVFAFVPHQLMRFVCSSLLQCTSTLSILPGYPRRNRYLGLLHTEDAVFWVPHSHDIGIGFGILTYNNRLQIGFSADSALIPDQNDVQSIADGVYDYIRLLEKEIDDVYS